MTSIIVPIYNVEKYLPRCIDSILNQTYKNLEIILVDDGSPDCCGAICDDYAQKDSRIRVIHKENGGISSARNAGLKVASGEYLMFVDSDDYISIDAVEVLRERLIRDGSDLAIGKYTDVYDNGETNGWFCAWMKDAILTSHDVFSQHKNNESIAVSLWGKLYKKYIFSNLDMIHLTCGEDKWVYPEIISRCRHISIVDKIIYFYYQRESSITHEKNSQSIVDSIHADLHFSQFLWERGYCKSAVKRYEDAVLKAYQYQPPSILSVYETYFSLQERKQLLTKANLKTKVRWLSIRNETVFSLVRYLKKCIGRKT